MRLLRINGEIADIDEDTAIGIDLQAYDFKDPGKLKVNVSNTFSLPATAKNMRILGSPGNPSRVDNTIYSRISVDYQVKNKMYITGGAARVESIKKGRINMFVAQRPGFIDRMKSVTLNQFLQQWFVHAFENYMFASYEALVNAYAEGRNGVILPAMIGTLADLPDEKERVIEYFGFDKGSEIVNEMAMRVQHHDEGWVAHGGHFCVFIEPLFKYFEEYFGVDLNSASPAAYSLFNDDVFKSLYIPCRNINVMDGTRMLEFVQFDQNSNLRPLVDVEPYADLSTFDLFVETLKLLGYGMEEVGEGFEIVRLDNIGSVPTHSDILPGCMEAEFRKEMEYKPIVEGYGQQNIIKMLPADDAGEMAGARVLVSNNENSEATKDLFTVNAYVPTFLSLLWYPFVPAMHEAKSVEKLTFFRSSQRRAIFTVSGKYQTIPPEVLQQLPKKIQKVIPRGDYSNTPDWQVVGVYLFAPEVYSVSAEYNFLESIINSPETYKVKRWVTSSQMENFRKIATYYVLELGGWFYVNKIKGFNPVKSKQPVEFELIKVPWQRMPQLPEKPIEISDRWIFETGYWDDGGIWKDSENWAFN
jgi:hypothetical protein